MIRKLLLPAPFFLMFSFALAQQGKVFGRVTGSDGQALPGVHITLQATGKGTATDEEGRYTLENLPNGATLTFSSIGYIAVDKIVTSSVIHVVMQEDVTHLNEIVVLGYNSRPLKTPASRIILDNFDKKSRKKRPKTRDLHQKTGR